MLLLTAHGIPGPRVLSAGDIGLKLKSEITAHFAAQGSPLALAQLAVRGGVTGPRLDLDVEPHLGDRPEQVALHVDRQRLQRRDVDRV